MTELFLVDALVKKLKDLFKDYELKSKSGLLQAVKVFPQYLPQPEPVTVNTIEEDETENKKIEPQGYSAADFESNFPCVIVKFDETTVREEGALNALRTNILFLVGIYDKSPDNQGYRDVLNIIDTIEQEILENRILEKKYRLEMPLKSYLFDEQPWPVFFGQIETTWETGRPMMPRNFARG